MKQALSKLAVVALITGGLVAITQPALAWVRVAVNVGMPGPVVIARAPVVVPAPIRYVRPAPAHYRPVWIPAHYNRWGAWIPSHWR